MFEKIAQSSGNVIGYRVAGVIEKSDYAPLTAEVEALVAQYGSIRMLCDMQEFRWEAVDAWGADLRFGSELHHKIEKMAIVGDKRWEQLIAKLVSPFYAKEGKYFSVAEIDQAWEWLRA